MPKKLPTEKNTPERALKIAAARRMLGHPAIVFDPLPPVKGSKKLTGKMKAEEYTQEQARKLAGTRRMLGHPAIVFDPLPPAKEVKKLAGKVQAVGKRPKQKAARLPSKGPKS